MYDAVIRNEWARNALWKTKSAPEPSFQQLYADLDLARLREKQEIEGRKRDGIANISESDLSCSPGIHFEDQSIYDRPRKPGSKSSLSVMLDRVGRNGTDKFGSQRLCRGCGSPDHMIKEGPKRKIKCQIVSNVARFIKKNHNIQREFCTNSAQIRKICLHPTKKIRPMFSLMNLAAISLIPFYKKKSKFFNTCRCTNWLDSSPWEWSYWKLFIQWVQSHYLVCKNFLRVICGYYWFTRLSWIVWWLFSTKVYNLCFHSCSLQYKELMHKLRHKILSWQKAYPDSGAQRTVTGLNQAKAYCTFVRLPSNLAENKSVYRFGSIFASLYASFQLKFPNQNPFLPWKSMS